jgi:hypothetical protein
MARDWETLFRNWSSPSSDHEAEKADNAERMIRDAIRDSDVDICVCCTDIIHNDFSHAPPGKNSVAALGLTPATYTFGELKRDIHQALNDKFGANGVTRGNKAFDVHANSYRVDADVVPAFVLRLYYKDGSYDDGTYIYSDSGSEIYNFPKQQHANGVTKNVDTSRRFKQITRSVKRLRNEMNEQGIAAAGPIPSFLIECLAYNTPDNLFENSSYKSNVQGVIATGFNATMSDEKCNDWFEVNKIKYLFRSSQPWNRAQVHSFLDAAWDYVGFE